MLRSLFLPPILLALSLLAAQQSSPAVGQEGDGPIRLLSHDYTIAFNEAIWFDIQAESDAGHIEEIQGFFRPLGPRTSTNYRYADFDRGPMVDATFSIPTAGGGVYFPPGAEFDVRYVIRDDAGNEFETPNIRVEYLDPDIDWQRMTVGELTAIYHDTREEDIEHLLSTVAERIPRMLEATGARGDGQYKAVFFNSLEEATQSFPQISEAAREEHFFAGFAYSNYNLFVLARPNVQSVAHELTHLFVGEATPSPLGRVPPWLNEGLAVYFENESPESGHGQITTLAARNRLLPFTTLDGVPGIRDQIGIFYVQSGHFVGYLIEEFGRGKMADVLAEINRGARIADAIYAAYGITLAALEDEWRASVGAPPLDRSGPSPVLEPEATPELAENGGPVPQPTAGPDNGGIGANIFRAENLPWLIALVLVVVAGAIVQARFRRRSGGREAP